MILTITVNPLLERRVYYKEIISGNVNRSIGEEFTAGGKGINVSRQLNILGEKNLAITFLGGENGKIFRHTLSNERIDFIPVSSRQDTRLGFLAIDMSRNYITSFFTPNPDYSEQECNEFISKAEKAIANSSIIVLSGSSVNEFTDKIFYSLIEIAKKDDKIVMLDTYGNHLQKCLELGPFAIHNNLDEIRKSLNIELSSEAEIRELMHNLYSKGIRMCFLTNGEGIFYSSKFDFHYKVTPPIVKPVDATGSGDSFVARLVYGLSKNEVYDEIIRSATAFGAANAITQKTCSVDPSAAEQFAKLAAIEPIGKKMKLIDDSPTI
ncbi:MAG: 1-phosphofructokinase [Ignavibacteriales bacterium]|nr:1-phosphofructokinase [Ignavibacteriales bacterium]MCF8305704.1 1-phosphofructokinase [Ignavibacteriales bacterium]MCF8315426.1 1-phosphofructokinase [Ignavibacteriales bacterium]MCF8437046.1 1-phosphofructokinase [Ignavibacteriales bacterium]